MSFQLTLTLDYRSDTEWRWVLLDGKGSYLADHEVRLEPADPVYASFVDLPRRLKALRGIHPPETTLAELGAWMGAKVFGAVGEKLLQYERSPACVVQVRIPPAAQALLFRPFELAHLKGKSLAERGFRFIYTVADSGLAQPSAKEEGGELRILGVFSLPDGATPLNLREERRRLQELVLRFGQMGNHAVTLRLLQYGTTRDHLKEVLEEAPGWDVLHFSGHGLQGELVLEKPDGSADRVKAEELSDLLRPTKHRLKLLALSACYSGAADVRAARAQIGLDPPTREPDLDLAATPTVLPSLGQRLAEEMDCAVLAMRYPVLDNFATELLLALYDRLLNKKQPLPQSLQLALDTAIKSESYNPGLSRITPLLFGSRAAELCLKAPKRQTESVQPRTGLLHFPNPPERFVGRLRPMLRASAALAPESGKTGVVFYGMAGAGKTACALELAYRYDKQHLARFTQFAWHKAPDEGHDIVGALTSFASALESQLPGLELVGRVDNLETLQRQALPLLRKMMQDHAILVVLDNVEGLLTSSDDWRDSRWGDVVAALLDHTGPSRLVITSRRLPRSLANAPCVQREAIFGLSFPESVLLARQMPNLRGLFADSEGRDKLRRVLGAVQGHPKLMELADKLATDPAKLEAHLARAGGLEAGGGTTQAFFTTGESDRPEDSFVRVLHGWTEEVAASLSTTARLLAHCLSRMEESDRTTDVLQATWPNLLKRLTGATGKPATPAPEPVLAWARSALAEERLGLDAAMRQLAQAGLVDVETLSARDGTQYFRVHPGVAESLLSGAPPALRGVVDREVGRYFVNMASFGEGSQSVGGGPWLVAGARSAVPYLIRQQRWGEASVMLEDLIARDTQPVTLAFATPLLQQIVVRTRGTELEMKSAGVLAKVLLQVGRHAEAEQMYRDILSRSRAQGDFRLAATATGDLIQLLLGRSRFEEALQAAGQHADYVRSAGLGPWSQLASEGLRLQALEAQGRYEEVLAKVERHRTALKTLSEQSHAPEIVRPWNVREALLGTGHSAALHISQWETALTFNAEIAESQRRRGAHDVEQARTRYRDHGPLLRLRRLTEARTVLEECRTVFEQTSDIASLAKVYSGLGELEGAEGRLPTAATFETTALRYKYQSGDPESCAVSHHNLALYLERSSGAPEVVLAHWLAAGAIRVQTNSGRLPTTLKLLARSTLPPAPPTFAQVAAEVEQFPGVRFSALFAELRGRFPSGDAAIQAVWDRVLAERGRRG